jgi:hypothetical protein
LRIEKEIQNKHEKLSHGSKRINVLSLFEYEKNYTSFTRLIYHSTLSSIQFWSELLEKQINVEAMHDIGIKIS